MLQWSAYMWIVRRCLHTMETGHFALSPFRPRSFRPTSKLFRPNLKSFRPDFKVVSFKVT